ncbi:uncharacterized protein LOC133848699 [Drosophila sulfurigaster albostrigata]|uniref:uncharacterized protein LOC133848699 n=1 Tax=Drosophila sulfurigaster albostrigata TaxID=89887 RepID=UPI002D21A940|nr:uncharacterized protein LOC133848699 [Drosophila sulfurigaster albostrigata]
MFAFAFWKNEAKKDQHENIPQIWKELNGTFITWSWLIYTIAVIVISICGYFAYCAIYRRNEIVQRRRIIQRAQQRPAQKRRPNAAYRDHQIYRYIILSIARYMKNTDGVRPFIDYMDHLSPLRHSQAEMALNIGHNGAEASMEN